jgi:predicted Fe-Mo cluster-binding NifX family protein
MRLALAVTNNKIADHFGHCDYFQVYNINDCKVVSEEKIKTPPHQKGLLPKFLKEHDINVLITGNIGSMAVELMEDLGIKAIRGVSGSIDKILSDYLNNNLNSSEETCTEHENHNH